MPGAERSSCVDCGNSGWIVVPHQAHVSGGLWESNATMAVACRCGVGRRTLAAYADRDVLSIEMYELQIMGHWRSTMAQRDQISEDRNEPVRVIRGNFEHSRRG